MTERLQQDASHRQVHNQQWNLENPLSNFTPEQIIILQEGSTWNQADIDADNKCLSYSCPILAGVPDVDESANGMAVTTPIINWSNIKAPLA